MPIICTAGHGAWCTSPFAAMISLRAGGGWASESTCRSSEPCRSSVPMIYLRKSTWRIRYSIAKAEGRRCDRLTSAHALLRHSRHSDGSLLAPRTPRTTRARFRRTCHPRESPTGQQASWWCRIPLAGGARCGNILEYSSHRAKAYLLGIRVAKYPARCSALTNSVGYCRAASRAFQ